MEILKMFAPGTFVSFKNGKGIIERVWQEKGRAITPDTEYTIAYHNGMKIRYTTKWHRQLKAISREAFIAYIKQSGNTALWGIMPKEK